MSKNEMISMIETMNNYDDLASKAKAKADAIREAIKEEMVRQNTEELVAGAYIVRFTNVISNRFDSTTFKRLYADLYKDFTKPRLQCCFPLCFIQRMKVFITPDIRNQQHATAMMQSPNGHQQLA